MGFPWNCNALMAEWIQRQALAHLQTLCLQIKCRKDVNCILSHSSKATRVGTINTSSTAPWASECCDLTELSDNTGVATRQTGHNKQYRVSVWRLAMFESGFHIQKRFCTVTLDLNSIYACLCACVCVHACVCVLHIFRINFELFCNFSFWNNSNSQKSYKNSTKNPHIPFTQIQ